MGGSPFLSPSFCSVLTEEFSAVKTEVVCKLSDSFFSLSKDFTSEDASLLFVGRNHIQPSRKTSV